MKNLRSSWEASNLYSGQRVGVFVDVQNMYYSARALYNSKVNFKEILKEAVRGRSLIRAIAYVIRAGIEEEQSFFDVLQSMGYEVKAKDLQVFPGGHKKGDWDIGIAMDAIELASKLDVIILVSGDGDFTPLVEHLRRALGCRVEVMAFGRSCSSKLIQAADEFIDLDREPERFLLGKP
ncbi:LabA-like NYN domain-containing protein [Candidatus Pyrohabitans sp.]